jgi:hypothetical protein
MPSIARANRRGQFCFAVPAARGSRAYSLHEARTFRQGRQRLDDAAVHQPEIADIFGDIDMAEIADQAIERMGRGAFGPALAVAAGAFGQHHIIALAPFRHHFRHHLGRVLQIAVHRDHRQSGSEIQPGAERALLAEIARQADHPDARVRGPVGLQPLKDVIGAAIIDAENLVAVGYALQNRHQAREEPVQHGAFVQHRHDDAQFYRFQRFGGHAGRVPC